MLPCTTSIASSTDGCVDSLGITFPLAVSCRGRDQSRGSVPLKLARKVDNISAGAQRCGRLLFSHTKECSATPSNHDSEQEECRYTQSLGAVLQVTDLSRSPIVREVADRCTWNIMCLLQRITWRTFFLTWGLSSLCHISCTEVKRMRCCHAQKALHLPHILHP